MALPIRFDQEPDSPPGTGTFHFDDGRSAFAYEPELAKSLGQQLRAQPDLRTAERQAIASDAPGAPQPYASDVSAPVPGVPLPLSREAVQQADSSGELAPPAVIARNGMARIPLPVQGAPQGGSLPEPPPIRQAARPGGFIPASQTVVTEAGPEYNIEDAADRAMANREVVKATLANFQAQREGAENEALSQQIRRVQLEDQAKQQQRELVKKQQDYAIQRAKAESLADSAEKRVIQPDRLWAQKGAAGKVALLLGQVFGAFGASLNHTNNWAADLWNRQVDADIAAQEDEIKAGRVGASNRLARLAQQFDGDIETAKSVLKETHLASLDAQIKEHAAWAKAPEAQRAAQLWLAQNQQARLLEEQKQQQLHEGKTTTTANLKYQAPQAGGSRPMTPKEEADYWKAKAEGKKFRDQYEGNALDETDQKAVERYGRARKGAEQLAGQVEATVSAAGGTVGKDGRIKLPEDVPGVGRIKSNFVPSWALSKQGRRVRQNFGEAAAAALKEKSGASATDAEYKRLEAIYQGGAKNEADLQEGLQILYNIGQRNIKNAESSYPANVRKTYRENYRASNAEQYADEDESDVAPL